MVNTILTKSGFIKNKTYKETKFVKPPKTTYAIYTDSFTGRGADSINLIREHTYNIELYSYTPDPTAEAKIEAVLDELGIEYDKSERYWFESEQLYEVIYTLNYIEK